MTTPSSTSAPPPPSTSAAPPPSAAVEPPTDPFHNPSYKYSGEYVPNESVRNMSG
ncbi:hypothetical protein OROMI_020980 [Orobanche minor]